MRLTWSKLGLPHGYLCAVPVHVVYRLEGCLPVGPLRALSRDLSDQLEVLRQLPHPPLTEIEQLQEAFLSQFDDLLDAQDQRKYLLSDQTVAQEVIQPWRKLEEMEVCLVHVCCVMGNHVHVLLEGFAGAQEIVVGDVLGRHKRYTQKQIRRHLNITAQIWAGGYFDRYVRPGQFEEVLRYILTNPVKAGLVRDWRDWPNTYVRGGTERCALAREVPSQN